MATATMPSCVEQIGEAAGLVWQVLDREGTMSLARLARETGVSRDLAMQAVGWLAREGKIEIQEKRRSRLASLK